MSPSACPPRYSRPFRSASQPANPSEEPQCHRDDRQDVVLCPEHTRQLAGAAAAADLADVVLFEVEGGACFGDVVGVIFKCVRYARISHPEWAFSQAVASL